MNEPARRTKLRSPLETGLGSQTEISWRRRLDAELGDLAATELKVQASFEEIDAAKVFRDNKDFEYLIQNSPAFVQYLNSYLYFGVRFAAEHLNKTTAPDAIHNERPTALPRPPACKGPSKDELRKDVELFLGLGHTGDMGEALDFLDDYVHHTDAAGKTIVIAAGENAAEDFDLWLRGLLPYAEDAERSQRIARFPAIARGLCQWAEQRYDFYVSLERRQGRDRRVDEWLAAKRVEGNWHARNPVAARCGVADLYWLAKILRADISPRGIVRYAHQSWLRHLPSVLTPPVSMERILRIEEVLRAVFDYACELVHNAVEISEYKQKKAACPGDYQNRPSRSVCWRAVQDAEIEEIRKQRRERQYQELGAGSTEAPTMVPRSNPSDETPDAHWSKRIETGEYEENLVGLAISGGGIRSATFALGILQRLKDIDLLRRVDYLSTVSGGGYIGAWLTGNVRRTRYWLSGLTSWDESIGFLRDYSKYLAPQTGFLSADTWVIWATWVRNATLIQLTAVAWLAALFVSAFVMKAVFEWSRIEWANTVEQVLLTVGFVILAANIGKSLHRPKPEPPTQHRWVVLLAWAGSFVAAALLWSVTVSKQDYSEILTSDYRVWPRYLEVLLFACLWLLAWISVSGDGTPSTRPVHPFLRFLGAFFAAVFSLGVVYLAVTGVHYVFGVWASWGKDQYGWYAFVFGPALVLLAVTVAVTVFIGLIGRTSVDSRREWWTRYGAWLSIFGAGFMALSLAAVFGSVWLAKLIGISETVKWGAVVGWAGSSIAGLLAGNSNRTKGDGEGSSISLEWVARIGGALFIVGAVLILSSVLHFVLVQVWLPNPADTWWEDLNALLRSGPSLWGATNLALETTFLLLLLCGGLFSWRFDLNTFGLNQFYRNRLVRCYLGATRWMPGLRKQDRFTGFDDKDDLSVEDLKWKPKDNPPYRGPFHIVNCSLNLGGSSDLSVKTRQSASFTVTPLVCGSDRHKLGYAPVNGADGFAGGVSMGQAISISGAAASPNMGYNTSPLVAILLTMFNVRLAWWFPNPGQKAWQWKLPPFGIKYLITEFLGLADETSAFVNVSDGGHFENLGIYELVRRHTKVIIASDGECDPDLAFGSLGNVIRICETDFGAKIDIDVTSIRKNEAGLSRAHCAVGRITYSNGSLGYLIYLKSSVTGDEEVDVQQYRSVHPDFPHESTADQFFTEDQFESYRRLGYQVAKLAFRDVDSTSAVVAIASKLYDVWIPSGFSNDSFVKHTNCLDDLWERFRTSEPLGPLFQELLAGKPGPVYQGDLTRQELSACLELAQLMENVFLDLRLDDRWEHPDNRGWAMLFTMWAQSPRFSLAWTTIRSTFGIRFEYFCQHRLGLPSQHPIARVSA